MYGMYVFVYTRFARYTIFASADASRGFARYTIFASADVSRGFAIFAEAEYIHRRSLTLQFIRYIHGIRCQVFTRYRIYEYSRNKNGNITQLYNLNLCLYI